MKMYELIDSFQCLSFPTLYLLQGWAFSDALIYKSFFKTCFSIYSKTGIAKLLTSKSPIVSIYDDTKGAPKL